MILFDGEIYACAQYVAPIHAAHVGLGTVRLTGLQGSFWCGRSLRCPSEASVPDEESTELSVVCQLAENCHSNDLDVSVDICRDSRRLVTICHTPKKKVAVRCALMTTTTESCRSRYPDMMTSNQHVTSLYATKTLPANSESGNLEAGRSGWRLLSSLGHLRQPRQPL